MAGTDTLNPDITQFSQFEGAGAVINMRIYNAETIDLSQQQFPSVPSFTREKV